MIEISPGPEKEDSILFDFTFSSLAIISDHWKEYVKKTYDAVSRITYGRHDNYQIKISIPNLQYVKDKKRKKMSEINNFFFLK